MYLKVVSATLLFLLTTTAQASSKADYLEFFNKFQKLGQSYDPAVVELYSNDAKIAAVRIMSDGKERNMKLSGEQWKKLLLDSLDIGKKRGDNSEFSNIQITVNDNQAKIKANRYSHVKCFEDTRYYMVVEKVNGKELKIVEEFMQSPATSSCANTPENDLSLVLQGSARMLNRHLPVMVDQDTRLDKASSEGNTLIYHYALVNYMSSELDPTSLEQNLTPMLAQQTCSMPNLRPIVDQGGSISYRYSGNDHKQILSIMIDKSACL